jgi:hypothetical protein
MNATFIQINLVLAWLWLLLGFVSGLGLGMNFHHESWLGGYTSLRRRLYRLGHISFFGLGAVNLLFWLTARTLSHAGPPVAVASWAFVVGAITMPLCCLIMAHAPRLHLIFAVPVLGLVTGGALMLGTVAWPDAWPQARAGLQTALQPPVQISQYWLADNTPPGPWTLNTR